MTEATTLDPTHIVGALWAWRGIVPMGSARPVLYGSGVDHRWPTSTTYSNPLDSGYGPGWTSVFVRTAPGHKECP